MVSTPQQRDKKQMLYRQVRVILATLNNSTTLLHKFRTARVLKLKKKKYFKNPPTPIPQSRGSRNLSFAASIHKNSQVSGTEVP